MDLTPDIQIKTAIKAMVDVVLPAVDPNNKLAQEQARLVIGMLSLAMQHLPLLFRYELDELKRFLDLAEILYAEAAHHTEETSENQAAAALWHSVRAGADVFDRARAEPSEVRAANFDLRRSIGELIGVLSSNADADRFKRVSDAVTFHAEKQQLRERSWLLGQKWEPNPESVPPIESLIGSGPSHA